MSLFRNQNRIINPFILCFMLIIPISAFYPINDIHYWHAISLLNHVSISFCQFIHIFEMQLSIYQSPSIEIKGSSVSGLWHPSFQVEPSHSRERSATLDRLAQPASPTSVSRGERKSCEEASKQKNRSKSIKIRSKIGSWSSFFFPRKTNSERLGDGARRLGKAVFAGHALRIPAFQELLPVARSALLRPRQPQVPHVARETRLSLHIQQGVSEDCPWPSDLLQQLSKPFNSAFI